MYTLQTVQRFIETFFVGKKNCIYVVLSVEKASRQILLQYACGGAPALPS